MQIDNATPPLAYTWLMVLLILWVFWSFFLMNDNIVEVIKNITIGILTADCAPILLYDSSQKIIGCIHSGWKGALNGIIKNTIKKRDSKQDS